MPYVPHLRVTAHFKLGPAATPKEEATCTTNFTFPTEFTTPDTFTNDSLDALVQDCFADWSAYVVAGDGYITNDVALDYCKAYKINALGKAVGYIATSSGDVVRGTISANHHPWQITNVVTLDADERGKGRFGRIYLPPQCFTVDSNGLIDGSTHAAMFTGVQTLLTNLSNGPGLDVGFGLAIAGRTGVAGTLKPVKKIRLGRVPDTQRRRRRSLEEAYAVNDFTP